MKFKKSYLLLGSMLSTAALPLVAMSCVKKEIKETKKTPLNDEVKEIKADEVLKTELDETKKELTKAKTELKETKTKLEKFDGSIKHSLLSLQNEKILPLTTKVITLMKEISQTYKHNQITIDLGKDYFQALLQLSQEAVAKSQESIKKQEYHLASQQLGAASLYYGEMRTEYVALKAIKSLLENMNQKTREWFITEAAKIKETLITAKTQEYKETLKDQKYVPHISDLYQAYANAIGAKLDIQK
ncbi:hypothetical protein U5U50_00870 [Mycoplasma sp. 888]|uniref:hypothetical protein n=1 Tax=Mycoplasma sp. 888 TaxID=3108483 RepID=UPI002D77FE93|nr:hypothetical protein [Mycoplasma sp. 888]WRQ25939.1 hypothetical protein U5U50_00870 [Mycoplasma sp. 888]